MKKVGIFGGSFNPVHVGHKKLIDETLSLDIFDKLFLVPTHQNPLKIETNFFPGQTRLDMLCAEFAHYDRVEIIDNELNRPPPSYTIDTLKYLKNLYPEIHFSLMVGTDVLKNFHLWKDFREILRMACLTVYRRKGLKIPAECFQRYSGIRNMELELPDVSSSEIRIKFQNGENLDGLVPENALKVIRR